MGLRTRIGWTIGGLLAFNLAVWVISLWTFRSYPVLLGSGVLAYTLGLRHAVDADHIAAIDNVTRKLMHDGKRPVTVGLFFALGHSSVVIAAIVVLALASNGAGLVQFRAAASLIGTGVSAAFLFAIAILNALGLLGVWRSIRASKRDGRGVGADVDLRLPAGGFLGRLLRPAFALVTRSGHMFPLGILFGLGFDTATEIAMLGLSAIGAQQGISLWSLLALPALFTAAMTLVDTADSIVMLGAYGWAFVNPMRKLRYNLAVTLMSVMIAVVIGGVELLGLVGHAFGGVRGPWRAIGGLIDQFGRLGCGILGVFIASWIGSVVASRLLGLGGPVATGPASRVGASQNLEDAIHRASCQPVADTDCDDAVEPLVTRP